MNDLIKIFRKDYKRFCENIDTTVNGLRDDLLRYITEEDLKILKAIYYERDIYKFRNEEYINEIAEYLSDKCLEDYLNIKYEKQYDNYEVEGILEGLRIYINNCEFESILLEAEESEEEDIEYHALLIEYDDECSPWNGTKLRTIWLLITDEKEAVFFNGIKYRKTNIDNINFEYLDRRYKCDLKKLIMEV